jgi:hypothetical protein
MLSPEKLEALAHIYIDECLNNYKEHPTASGKLVLIKDRHIPTIDFFLRIWIPNKNKETICRSTYYNWLNGSNIYKAETIKNIEGLFKALATDIVANEGKGIFYAKNKLGMTDKSQTQFVEQPIFPMFCELDDLPLNEIDEIVRGIKEKRGIEQRQ